MAQHELLVGFNSRHLLLSGFRIRNLTSLPIDLATRFKVKTNCKQCGSDMPPAHKFGGSRNFKVSPITTLAKVVTGEVSEGQIRDRSFDDADDLHRDPIEVPSSEEVTVKAIVDDEYAK